MYQYWKELLISHSVCPNVINKLIYIWVFICFYIASHLSYGLKSVDF